MNRPVQKLSPARQTNTPPNPFARYMNRALNRVGFRSGKKNFHVARKPERKKVHVAIDCYDDIFSDFDPRPYCEREISEDLFKELLCRFSKIIDWTKIELAFSIPARERRVEQERVICDRLREEFGHRLGEVSKKLKRQRLKGWLMVLVGEALLVGEVLLSKFCGGLSDTVKQLLFAFSTPAGWYGAFMGIERLLEIPESLKKEKELYSKLDGCKISFEAD